MSDAPKHTVMVSSTSLDLPEHRKAAIDSIWQRNMFPLAMESLPATPENAIQVSLDMVDKAKVYVGIFGHRYGYVPDHPRNPDKISVTEMEYRRAFERKIPILIFFMHDEHPGPKVADAKDFYEFDNEKEVKLKRLKAELGTRYVADFFKSPHELNAQIYHALTELNEKGQISYEAADEKSDSEKQIPLPKPPEIYTPHRYILTQIFVGRKAELKVLDEWADSGDSTLIVEAIGGMGKSALTWEWFNQQERFAGRFWWSFYESDSAFTNFTRHALAYLTGQPPKTFDAVPGEERERQLLTVLAEKPYLLVLDGLERILVAYHRLDAPHLLDDEADISRPDTQKGTTAGLRDCIDSRHADFLRKLAAVQNSKVLISTRLIPADLQNKAGQLLPRVAWHRLNGLADSDAVALMKHLGVHGDKGAMTRFLRQFDNHSLLLTVIAGRIGDYFPARGDFDAWLPDEGVRLRLGELDLKQRRTAILEYALNGLTPELQKFLSQIAAFRYPVDYNTLSALNPYVPPKPKAVGEPGTWALDYDRERLEQATDDEEKALWQKELADDQASYDAQKAAYDRYPSDLAAWEGEYRRMLPDFHAGLKELEGRGLLQWERTANTYDLHPVVRAYAFERLQGDDRQNTFTHIRDHFEGIPPKPLDDVRELGDLHRDLEIYGALVGAGLLDAASDFYGARLTNVLDYQLAVYHQIIELLTPLFPNGFNQPPTLTGAYRQSTRIVDLGGCLYQIGRNTEALKLWVLNLKVMLDDGSVRDLGAGLEGYSLTLRGQNQLAAALKARQIALDLAETAEQQDGIALAHLRLMRLYVDTGQRPKAETHYQAFMANPPQSQTDFWKTDAETYYSEMLIQQGVDTGDALKRAEALAVQSKDALNLMVIYRLRGEVALNQKQPDAALEYFNRAAGMARQSGSSDLSMHIGGVARAYAQMGEREQALQYLDEALVNPLGESQVEVLVAAAELYLTLGETEKAREYALQAYEWAWADGPPYIWWWNLERAKKVLDALGEPYPDLPPFDPAKVEPIPYEAEIRVFIEELKAEKAEREVRGEPPPPTFDFDDDDDASDDE